MDWLSANGQEVPKPAYPMKNSGLDSPIDDRPGAMKTKGGGWHNPSLDSHNTTRYTSEVWAAWHGGLGWRVAFDGPDLSTPHEHELPTEPAYLPAQVDSLVNQIRHRLPGCQAEVGDEVARLLQAAKAGSTCHSELDALTGHLSRLENLDQAVVRALFRNRATANGPGPTAHFRQADGLV